RWVSTPAMATLLLSVDKEPFFWVYRRNNRHCLNTRQCTREIHQIRLGHIFPNLFAATERSATAGMGFAQRPEIDRALEEECISCGVNQGSRKGNRRLVIEFFLQVGKLRFVNNLAGAVNEPGAAF